MTNRPLRRHPDRRQPRAGAKITRVLILSLLAASVTGSSALSAPVSPPGSIAKKCRHGKKGAKCRKKRSKRANAKIQLTNCPNAPLTPNVPYTFTGRVVPARAGLQIIVQYFDQGTNPLASHTATTAKDGSFSDTYAYPPTGVPRGGTVRASSTKAIDPLCQVTISEM